MSRVSAETARMTVDNYRRNIDNTLDEIARNFNNMRLVNTNRGGDMAEIIGTIQEELRYILDKLDELQFHD